MYKYRLVTSAGQCGYDPTGPVGEPVLPAGREFEPLRLDNGAVVPFSPRQHWVMAPTGTMVSGVSDRYRFRMDHPDGSSVVVDKAWEPVSVQSEEAGWYRRLYTADARAFDTEWTWSGPEIPPTKPAYRDLVATAEGGVWVIRDGPGRELPGCADETWDPRAMIAAPCWEETTIIDAFGPDGRYAGSVALPAGFQARPRPVVRGNQVVAVVEDAAGTIKVKRYRLTPPATGTGSS